MKILRVIISVLLTLVLFYFSSINSEGRSEYIAYSENDYIFEFNTVPKEYEYDTATFPVTIKGNLDENRILLRFTDPGSGVTTPLEQYKSVPLTLDQPDSSIFQGRLAAGRKLQRMYYYFEVIDSTGRQIVLFKNDNGQPFSLRAIGHVPVPVLVIHIFLMFVTVFGIIMATFHSLNLVAGAGDPRPAGVLFLIACLSAFLGGYPFGWAMNHYAFGTFWEGVPFGTDATDNKTQILFLYLVFVTLASIGSITNRRFGRDIYSPRALGWFGLGAFILMVIIYFIPHSIQFEPGLTYAVGFSWITVVVLLYLVGVFKSRQEKIINDR